MRNPFHYGGIVSGDAFCNRQKELHDLKRAMENGDKLFVYSERRMGKTSLVKAALAQLEEKRFYKIYVDLWPTEDELTFTTATAKAISEAVSTSADKLLETAKRFFSRLSPSITLDESGRPQVTFQIREPREGGQELEEVLQVPKELARGGRKRVVVVFDEFQQVLEYRSDVVERKLRSVIQTHEEIAYIFLGSRKHLIQRMVLDQSRPLYRAGGHYPLGPIAEEHWLPFIQERFERADKPISAEQVHAICELTQGHPFYTQHLCHPLWELCEPGTPINEDLIEEAVQLLLERESYAYATLWESLSPNQRRFLKGLAQEPPPVKPFSAEFLRTYRLGTASNAQRAAEALLERDVIDRENGSYLIADRFFRLWVQRMT